MVTITPEPQTEPTRSNARRWILAIVSVLVAAAVVTVVLFLIYGGPSAGDPTPPDEAAPVEEIDDPVSTEPLDIAAPTTGPLTDDEAAETARAAETAAAVVQSMNEIGARGDGSEVGLEQIATGFVLGELQAFAREQFDLGYRQIGEAVVVSTEATDVDLTGTPATIQLTVCVDVSGIDVVDAAGNSYRESLYNPGHPVKHIYGAEYVGDTWKITTHEIPDTQDCPAT